VAHGRPDPLDTNEPRNLGRTIRAMGLRYVVITSVDRDDLRDGGAGHFVACIQAVRAASPEIRIEILVPDFRGRMDRALDIFRAAPPDVFNHNLETVPRLQPSRHHLPVARFVHPDEFEQLRELGESLGFAQVASGPMVRSSYHADRQAAGLV
jgi:lipoate synthase